MPASLPWMWADSGPNGGQIFRSVPRGDSLREYYRPVSATSKWFVAPRCLPRMFPSTCTIVRRRLAQYRIGRYGGGVDWGFAINRFSEFRLGYEVGYFNSSLSVGSPVLPEPRGRTGVSSIRYSLDKLDSPLVPRTGQIAQVSRCLDRRRSWRRQGVSFVRGIFRSDSPS